MQEKSLIKKRTDGFLFPENSDKPGIHSESQPALRLRIGQARKKASLAVRRWNLTGYAGLSPIRAKIFYPPLSAFISVHQR
jgi:hypothetical protein